MSERGIEASDAAANLRALNATLTYGSSVTSSRRFRIDVTVVSGRAVIVTDGRSSDDVAIFLAKWYPSEKARAQENKARE